MFGLDKESIKDVAVEGAKKCKDQEAVLDGSVIRYDYSPESFTLTEPEYTIEVCEAVMDVIEPTPDDPIILNRSTCSTTPSTRLAKARTPPPWHTSRPCSPPSNASSTDRTSRVRLVAFLS